MDIKLSKKLFKRIKSLTLIAIIFIVVAFGVSTVVSNNNVILAPAVCITTFFDGDGPYYKDNSPFRFKLANENSTAQKLVVEGYVWNTNCTKTIPNMVLDIWHADETGTYVDEWNRGKVTTDSNGKFYFETIMPKGYGEGTGYRPPHIHYKAWVNNRLIITSEMFFNDTLDKPGFNNAYIIDAKVVGNTTYGKYNVVLPGID